MITEETIKKLDDLKIGEEYLNGKSTTEIQKEYKISWNTLHQYFILRHIQTRPAKRRESLRPKAPVGAKFGLWTVVSDEVKVGNGSRNLYWLVQCSCGALTWKNSASLKSGATTRCKRCGNKSYMTDEGLADTNAIIKHKYDQTLKGLPARCRKRKSNIEFDLSLDYLNELYERQGHKCALSGISIEPDLSLPINQQYMSIDRIDSSKGYTNDNVQWVDKRINMMKGTLSNEEFIDLCNKVSSYSKCE